MGRDRLVVPVEQGLVTDMPDSPDRKRQKRLNKSSAELIEELEAIESGFADREACLKRTCEELKQSLDESSRQLDESNQYKRGLVEHAPIGICQVDNNGGFISANSTLADILGYDNPEDLIDSITNIGEQLYVNKGQRAEVLENLKNGTSLPFTEFEFYRKDGSKVWVSENAITRTDETGAVTHYECFMRDVTERVKYQQDRDHFETLMTQAAQVAGIGYWILDHQSHSMLHWSEGMVNIFGIAANQSKQMPMTVNTIQMIDSDDLERVQEYYAAFKNSGERYDIQYRIIRADGGKRWLREIGIGVDWEGGCCSRSVGVVQDITDFKQAEIERDAMIDRLRLTMEAISSGGWDWNILTGYINYNSASWLESLGYDANEIEPTFAFWESKVHPDDLEYLTPRMAESLSNHEPLYIEDYRLRTKAGEYRWYQDYGRVIEWDESGNPARMVGISTDITERYYIEKELKESRALSQALLDNSSSVISVKDVQGRFLLVNREFERVFKVRSEDLIGKTSLEVLPAELIESSMEHDHEVLDNKRVSVSEYKFHVGDREHVMYASKFPIVDEAQNFIGIGSIAVDISEQKQVELERSKNAERLQLTLEAVSAGGWDWNIATGEMIVSDGWYQAMGYQKDGVHVDIVFWENMIHPNDKENVLSVLNACLKDRTPFYTCNYRVRNESGEYHWNMAQGRVIEYDDSENPARMVGTDTDITQQYYAEEALKQSRAQLQSIMDYSPATITLKDLEGNYLLVNKQQVDLYNISAKDMLGEHTSHVLPESLVESALAQDKEVVDTMQPSTREHNFRIGDETFTLLASKFLVMDDEQKPTAIGTIATDITELKKVEAALKESEKEIQRVHDQMTAIIESLPEGFFWYDQDDRLVIANRKIHEFYKNAEDLLQPGCNFEEGLRKAVAQGQFPEATGREEEWIQVRLEKFRNPGEISQQLLNDGRWLRVSERRLPDGSYVSVRTDITDIKNMEVELVRQERLATLGQLTATVSHELRNPLGAMRPSLYILQKRLPAGDERLNAAFDRLDRNIDRCDNIIDQMLDFTRIEGAGRQRLNIDQWLAEQLDELNTPEGLTVKREFGLGDEILTFDPEQLRRALVNVYDNACQAMMDNTIQAPIGPNMRLTVKTRINNDRVEIIVSDTGPGIPVDVLPKIFEPLFSTKGFGVGLGLPTVRQIMQKHNGDIEVLPEQGGGTAMVLWLPAHRDDENQGELVQ